MEHVLVVLDLHHVLHLHECQIGIRGILHSHFHYSCYQNQWRSQYRRRYNMGKFGWIHDDYKHLRKYCGGERNEYQLMCLYYEIVFVQYLIFLFVKVLTMSPFSRIILMLQIRTEEPAPLLPTKYSTSNTFWSRSLWVVENMSLHSVPVTISRFVSSLWRTLEGIFRVVNYRLVRQLVKKIQFGDLLEQILRKIPMSSFPLQ